MRADGRWSGVGAAGLVLALPLAACTGAADGGAPTQTPSGVAVSADGLAGPLCPMLPAGEEPGNPSSLEDLPPNEALTWIPVATVFEAAVRATDLDLSAGDGVTLLVPSDDTFAATFSEDTLDDLLLHRTAELRALLRAHVLQGTRSLSDLAGDGSSTTAAGSTVAVDETAGVVTFDGAGVLCGDYRARGARIHVIDAVLGDLPAPAAGEEDAH